MHWSQPLALHIYRAYSLCIGSEVELPELSPTEGDPDVVVRLRPLSPSDHPGKPSLSEVFGELPGIAKVLIRDGQEVWLDPYAGNYSSRLSPNILGGCMAVILQQRGYLVLHASSVVVGGQAIAFLGQSGAGKSTLAAAFHGQGYPLLTDDVLPVQIGATASQVIPSFPRIKLWPETLAAIAPNPPELTPLYEGSHKWSYLTAAPRLEQTFPLKRIYLLEKGEAHSIQPTSPQVTFAAMMQHRRSPNALSNTEIAATLLSQTSQLINQVTCKRFIRRPDLGALPDLVKLVETDLEY